jgi:hypothetical protein
MTDPVFSPDARYAAGFTSSASGSELTVVELKTGVEFLPFGSTAPAADFHLSWSQDGDSLLIAQAGKTPAFLLWNSLKPDAVADLKQASGSRFDDVFWAQDAPRLYGDLKGTLYEMVPDALRPTIVGLSLSAPVVQGGMLYGFMSGAPTTLVRRRLSATETETVAELPAPNFLPLDARVGRVAYVSKDADRLFVIDPAGDHPKIFAARGQDGAWSANGNRLLYWNDVELRIYDARSGDDRLVTRVAGPISKAAWHQPEWNVLYAVNGGLFAVETAEQVGRLTVPLADFGEISDFTVSRDGAVAFIIGSKAGQAGLWRLPLR